MPIAGGGVTVWIRGVPFLGLGENAVVGPQHSQDFIRIGNHFVVKAPNQEKRLMDQLRLRNGNLEISLSHQDQGAASL